MRYWRQRVLLFLLQMAGQKHVSRLQLMKWLFLLKEEEDIDSYGHFYDFFPYKYGPFSFLVYKDIEELRQEGWMEEGEEYLQYIGLDSSNKRLLSSSEGAERVVKLLEKYEKRPLEDLLGYVYQRYPWYASRSEHKKRLGTELSFRANPAIYTIGYQGVSIDGFLNRLLRTGITDVIDVRSVPFSHKYGFSKPIFRSKCTQIGIHYYHFPEAGVPTKIRRTISDDRSLWTIYKESILPTISKRVEEIAEICKAGAATLVCVEKKPEECHRHLLAQAVSSRIRLEVLHL